MNKEIKSTPVVKDLIGKMNNIPSFKYRFSSAQEYVEYMMIRDYELMRKNPNKPIL